MLPQVKLASLPEEILILIIKFALKPVTELQQILLLRRIFTTCKSFASLSKNDELWKFCFRNLWPSLWYADEARGQRWRDRVIFEAQIRGNWKNARFSLSLLRAGAQEVERDGAAAPEPTDFLSLLGKKMGKNDGEPDCILELCRDRVIVVTNQKLEIWQLPEGNLLNVSDLDIHAERSSEDRKIVSATTCPEIQKCVVFYDDGALCLVDVETVSVVKILQLAPIDLDDVDSTLDMNQYLCVVEEGHSRLTIVDTKRWNILQRVGPTSTQLRADPEWEVSARVGGKFVATMTERIPRDADLEAETVETTIEIVLWELLELETGPALHRKFSWNSGYNAFTLSDFNERTIMILGNSTVVVGIDTDSGLVLWEYRLRLSLEDGGQRQIFLDTHNSHISALFVSVFYGDQEFVEDILSVETGLSLGDDSPEFSRCKGFMQMALGQSCPHGSLSVVPIAHFDSAGGDPSGASGGVVAMVANLAERNRSVDAPPRAVESSEDPNTLAALPSRLDLFNSPDGEIFTEDFRIPHTRGIGFWNVGMKTPVPIDVMDLDKLMACANNRYIVLMSTSSNSIKVYDFGCDFETWRRTAEERCPDWLRDCAHRCLPQEVEALREAEEMGLAGGDCVLFNASRGYLSGSLGLACGSAIDIRKGYRILCRASHLGHANSTFMLACCQFSEIVPGNRNCKETLALAASQGHAKAARILGLLVAVEQGNPLLGEANANGNWREDAIRWLNEAVRLGCVEAKTDIELLSTSNPVLSNMSVDFGEDFDFLLFPELMWRNPNE